MPIPDGNALPQLEHASGSIGPVEDGTKRFTAAASVRNILSFPPRSDTQRCLWVMSRPFAMPPPVVLLQLPCRNYHKWKARFRSGRRARKPVQCPQVPRRRKAGTCCARCGEMCRAATEPRTVLLSCRSPDKKHVPPESHPVRTGIAARIRRPSRWA